MRGPAILIAGILFLAVPVGAQPLAVSASALEANGNVAAEGQLVLLVKDGTDANPFFQLSAETLRVEVVVGDPTVAVADNWLNHDPRTEERLYERATVEGAAARPAHQWLLVATDARVALTSECLHSQPAGATRVERASNVDGTRPGIGADVAETTRFQACGDATYVRVEGDFTLGLWEWDATLQEGSATHELESGRGHSDADPVGSPESQSVVQERREVFLHVTDGSLEVPLEQGQALYLAEPELTASGSLLAWGATGTLRDGQDQVAFEDDSLYVEGAVHASLASGDRMLDIQMSGDIDKIQVNGQSVYARPVPESTDLSGFGWFMAAALVVAAFGGLWWALPRRAMGRALERDPSWQTQPVTPREERAMGWYSMALEARRRHGYRFALLLCNRAVKTAPHVGDHYWLRSLILKKLDRDSQSAQDLRRLVGLLPAGEGRARAAESLARAYLRLGRDDEARDCLSVVRRDAPALYLAIAREPLFRRLGNTRVAWEQAPDVA